MRRSLALAAVALVAAGCAGPGPASLRGDGGATLDLGRASDSLLARPDLQAVVDLQVRRDAAGLIGALSDPDSVVRGRAAYALGSVQSAEAVPALRRLLADPTPSVRADAAFAIGQSADTTAGVALAVALRREATPVVAAEILEALGKTGGAPDLDAVLNATLPAVLEPHRALALARFGLRETTSDAWAEWLARHLRAEDPALRRHAAYAFTRAPVEAWRGQAGALRDAFDALPGDPARTSLARALGRLEDARDVPRLAGALAADADWRTRVQAARALAQAEGPEALAALRSAVGDANPHVAQAAMNALAEAEDTGAVALALALVEGDRPWPVQAAALPLVAPTRADAVLAWADRQTSPFARAAALRALGASSDGAVLTRLFTAATGDELVEAAAALTALRQLWETGAYGARRFFDTFAAAVRRGDLATTTIAAPVLADSAFWALGAGEVLRETYARLDAPADLEPMQSILAAIGRVRDGGEIDFLLGVAMEGPLGLREAARDALNERLSEGVEVSLTGASLAATTSIDWAYLAVVGRHPRLVLDTDRGRVTIELDTEAAPQTVQRIVTAASDDLYDGVPFHRVVSDFVVQSGDYVRRDGYGGPETAIRSEFTRLRYGAGVLGMASSGKDTEGSQWFITHSPQPHLDGRYTAFGRVVSGQDVVDRILIGDRVRSARVVPDR